MSNETADEAKREGGEAIDSPDGDEHAPQLTAKDFPIGTTIDGKYRVQSILGQGGMGFVIAAEHLQLRERVALKFLRVDENANKESFRSRFRREAQIAAKIRNEHITRVIDVGTWRDAEYMVMEHLDGNDLRQVMRASGRGGMPLERAIDYAVQTCEGLAEVHARGVVHRDLKPSNLFVVPRSDGGELIKILDFGISKWGAEMDVEEDELTKTGVVLGSPKYMAPEQIFGSSSVDARADVWSLGAITYEMVTGRPPFEEPTFARLCARIASGTPPRPPRELRPELPERVAAAIMLCFEPNRDQRIPSVAAFAGELLAAMGDALAEPIRHRLQLVLDGGVAIAVTGENGQLMRSGSYVSLSLSRTGSAPGAKTAAAILAEETLVAPPAEKKSRKALIAGLATVAVVAGIFAFRRPGSSPSTPVEPVQTAAHPSLTVSATATMASQTTASPSATSVAMLPVTAQATTSTAVKQPGQTAKKSSSGTKATEPAPIVVEAPPPPPPPPASPPTPPPPAKFNPLEDRQ